MSQELEYHVVRTMVALCGVAATSSDLRIRDDMRDEAMSLASIWLHQPEELHVWARRMHAELQALHGSEAALVAQTAIIRLQVVLAPQAQVHAIDHSPAPEPTLSGEDVPAPQRIIEYIRQHPDVRTKDLVDYFTGTISPRTIKRTLKDLTDSGVVARKEMLGAVLYRVGT